MNSHCLENGIKAIYIMQTCSRKSNKQTNTLLICLLNMNQIIKRFQVKFHKKLCNLFLNRSKKTSVKFDSNFSLSFLCFSLYFWVIIVYNFPLSAINPVYAPYSYISELLLFTISSIRDKPCVRTISKINPVYALYRTKSWNALLCIHIILVQWVYMGIHISVSIYRVSQ